MSKLTKKDLEEARRALSHYLSDTFKAKIIISSRLVEEVPTDAQLEDLFEGGENGAGELFHDFLGYLPLIRQKPIKGNPFDFFLPLSSKVPTLSPPVALVINTLLTDLSGVPFEVPTFFYQDGSAQVVNFDPGALAKAVVVLALHPEYLNDLCPQAFPQQQKAGV